jgi:hypothetical protein
MTETVPAAQVHLRLSLLFLVDNNEEGRNRLATEISTDPPLAHSVILALVVALSDARNRARNLPITARPATIEELDDVLDRACAWASELADGVQR